MQRATDIAEQMVGIGMSDILGPLAYDKQGGGQFLGGGNNPRRSVSDATAQAIDKEVRDLVDDAHETALKILRNNLPLLESISQKILKEEVIEGEDLKNLLAESKMLHSRIYSSSNYHLKPKKLSKKNFYLALICLMKRNNHILDIAKKIKNKNFDYHLKNKVLGLIFGQLRPEQS